jgi:hypothetical protein
MSLFNNVHAPPLYTFLQFTTESRSGITSATLKKCYSTSLSFYKILCCNGDIFTLMGTGDRLSRLPRLLPFSVFARVGRACLYLLAA